MFPTSPSPSAPARRRQMTRLGALVVTFSVAAGALAGPALATDADVSAAVTDATSTGSPSTGSPPGWAVERLSATPSGEQADGESRSPALSADGRHVSYVTAASNLSGVAMPVAATRVVVEDLVTGVVEHVSFDHEGAPVSAPSAADVSADGSVVAMISAADKGRVQVRDRIATSTLESTAVQGTRSAAIDDSGTRVVYADHTTSKELQTEDVRLFLPGADVADVPLSAIADNYESASRPSISADGASVAFDTHIAEVPLGMRVLDVSDLSAVTSVADIPVRVEIPGGRLPDLDGTGQSFAYAAFDTDGSDRILVHDIASGTDEVIAEVADGLRVADLVMSADGSTVAFSAAVATGGEDDANLTGDADLVIVDRATGASETIATTDATDTFDVATDGSAVVFSSTSAAFVAGDAPGTSDVFIARRVSTTAPTWPAGAALDTTDAGSSFVTVAWPAAADDFAVVNYRVFVDGAIVAQLDSSARAHTATGLTAATAYGFSVVAVDAEGNESAPLAVSASTVAAPDTPGTAALTLHAGPGGRVRLSWDPAGPDTTYVVSRTTADGTFAAVADVPDGTTTYADTGLAAATAYTYRVEAVDGGTTTHHTVERSVTTPAIAVGSVTWQGRARVGGTIDVDIRGDAGWKASAEVEYTTWYGDDGSLLDAPRTLTTTVPAVEDLGIAGRYAASFVLVDGIAEVTAVRGVLTDGHGTTVRTSAAQPATTVRGALHLVLDPATDLRLSGRVIVDGIAQRPLGDWADWNLEAVAPGTRRIRVLDLAGGVMADTTVDVVDGRRIDVALAPRQLGLVTARLVDEAGVPVAGATVQVSLVANRAALGAVVSDRVGNVQVPGSLFVGDEVELAIAPRAGSELSATVATLTAVATDERVDVVVSSNRTGVLSGRITLDGDLPAAGARVVISQTSNGTSRSFRAVTDADGRYTVRGWAGPATVVVNYRQDPTASMGTVVLGDAPTTGDFSLAIAGTYRIVTSLSTRTMDDATWVPVDINPLNAWHFRLTLEAGRTKSIIGATETVIRAVPGEVVTLCADGKEVGMGQACRQVTLGDASVVPVDLRVGSAGRVTFSVVDSRGRELHPAFETNVSVLRRTAGGNYESVAFAHANEADFELDLAQPGHYRLAISTYVPVRPPSTLTTSSSAASGSASSDSARTVEFDLADGELVELGPIALGTSRFSTRSDVTVVRPVVPAGGVAEVRAALRPDVPAAYTAMSARLTIPAGTSVVAGSVTVDGHAVEFTRVDDVAIVELGDRTFAADDEVVVRYRLATDGVEPGSGFNASVNVRSTVGGAEVTGLAGSPTVKVAGVTIDGPTRSASNTVVLSGLAPANTVVRVTEARQELGRTLSSAGGRWRLTVTLPDLGPGEIHPVVASVTILDDAGYDRVVSSHTRAITVDPRYPELVGVSLVQRNGNTDGATVDIDPRDGVAHVPYVFRGDPGTLAIETQFAGRGEVTSVDVSVGSVRAGASEPIGDDRFRSMVTVRNTELGGVYATYEAVPDAMSLDDVPVFTEEEVRAQLPPELADAPFTPQVDVDVDEATGIRTVRVTPAIPGMPDSSSTFTIERGVLYTPTAADLEAARGAGVPAYGLVFEIDRFGDRVTMSGSVLVPESVLDETTFGPALNPFGLVREGFQIAFNVGTTVDGFIGDYGALGKFERIKGIQAWMNKNCSAADSAAAMPLLQEINDRAVYTDIFKMGMQAAGFVVGLGTFGIGTVGFWAVTFFVDKLIDWRINKSLDEFETFVKEFCEDEEDDPYSDWPEENQPDTNNELPLSPARRLIDPVWIHDPSGYVYEGVPSNRIIGVTATLTYSPTADGTFEVWDAEWFGQSNPLVTDGTGAYGWDVPEGFWQVVYTMDGYETARSAVLEVLPPHFDVDVGLARLAPPRVESVDASAGPGRGTSVTVRFDNYMRLDAGDLIEVIDPTGAAIEGTVVAVDAEDGPLGRFASEFRVDLPTEFDGELTVQVGSLASDHAGRPMTDDFSTTVGVVVDDTEAPAIMATVAPAPNRAGWSNGPVEVVLHAEDSGTGVASVDWTAEGAVTGSGSERGADAVVPIASDGSTVVRSTATDAAGNVSDAVETTVRIDTVAPVSTIQSPAPGQKVTIGAALVARFDCADSGAAELASGIGSCVGRLADGTEVAVGATLPTGAVGLRTLEVTATDVAGNATTSTVTYEVTAPPAPPSPPSTPSTKAAIGLIDDQLVAIHTLKVGLVRELALAVPLALAKVAATIGARSAACAAIQLYDGLVTSYASKKWITAAQSAPLRTAAATIRTTLAC